MPRKPKQSKPEDGRALYWKRKFNVCDSRRKACEQSLCSVETELRQATERRQFLHDFYMNNRDAHNTALRETRKAQIAAQAAEATVQDWQIRYRTLEDAYSEMLSTYQILAEQEGAIPPIKFPALIRVFM